MEHQPVLILTSVEDEMNEPKTTAKNGIYILAPISIIFSFSGAIAFQIRWILLTAITIGVMNTLLTLKLLFSTCCRRQFVVFYVIFLIFTMIFNIYSVARFNIKKYYFVTEHKKDRNIKIAIIYLFIIGFLFEYAYYKIVVYDYKQMYPNTPFKF